MVALPGCSPGSPTLLFRVALLGSWVALLGCSPGSLPDWPLGLLPGLLFSWLALLGCSSRGLLCSRGLLSWVALLGYFPGLISWVALLDDFPGLLPWVALLDGCPGWLSRSLASPPCFGVSRWSHLCIYFPPRQSGVVRFLN